MSKPLAIGRSPAPVSLQQTSPGARRPAAGPEPDLGISTVYLT